MGDSWHSTMKLTPDQRLDVLNLLNHTDTRLGREAIDEVHRRTVVHGWSAEHWLLTRHGRLEGYALMTGQYAWRNPAGDHILPGNAPLSIPPGTLTVPALLRAAGYRTDRKSTRLN